MNMDYEMNKHLHPSNSNCICTNSSQCEGLQFQLRFKCAKLSSQNHLYGVVDLLTFGTANSVEIC